MRQRIVMALSLLALGLVLLVSGAREAQQRERYLQEGQAIQAHVIGGEVVPPSGSATMLSERGRDQTVSRTRYLLLLRWTVAGEESTGVAERYITRSVFDSVGIGEVVDAVLVPPRGDDPQLVILASTVETLGTVVIASRLLGLLFIFFGLAVPLLPRPGSRPPGD